jgi:hypothetical protein
VPVLLVPTEVTDASVGDVSGEGTQLAHAGDVQVLDR